jgi:putative Holliday junction resolvase
VTRILGVDWGTKRVGVAVSDPGRHLARPLPTLSPSTPDEAVRGIVRAARDAGAQTVLVGLPLHMNGEEGASARKARRLGEALEKAGLTVIYRDERLTTEEALELLRQQGDRRPDRERVDQMAALVLLQDYLDTVP